ncbi:MAG: zinc ABC transporter substrate-binding protein [Pseudomonadota bacterium]
MRRLLLLLLLFALPLPARATLEVVATLPDLAAIAREIGGAQVRVTAMAQPGQDPHFVDAKPSLALGLARADLLIVAGLELEVGWLPVLLTGARNARIQKGAPGYLDCSTLVAVLEIPTAPVDRSMGDVHPGGNPHYLLDPRRGLAVGRGIAARLEQIDPAHAAAYRAGLAAFETTLSAKIAAWEATAASLRGRPVVSYHRSLGYLADWLGFEVIAELEPKPGIPPRPAQLAEVLQRAQARGVRLVLQEAYYPASTSRAVAEKTSMKLVILPGGADFAAGGSYADRIDGLVSSLVQAAGP